jgi:phosphoglycolate phosphatase-like HAD superfamily hydrolase
MQNQALLAIDFDGVLCDSVRECFAGSWLAFYERILGSPRSAVRLEDYRRFRRFRPFIRSGEDYVLLQRVIHDGIELQSQADFDRELRREGSARMEEYGSAFYGVRELLLESERPFWLALNPLFPGLAEPLRAIRGDPGCIILSTKRPPFIREILLHHGIDWPLSRILHPGKGRKWDIIQEQLERRGEPGGWVVFVEDQPDHFADCPRERARCLLATWGYVKPEWVRDWGTANIELDAFVALLCERGATGA